MFHTTHFPPVEVHQMWAFTTGEAEVKVVYTCHFRLNVGYQCLPFFPTTSTWHIKTSKQLSLQAIYAHFDSTTAQTTCYTSSKGTWEHATEVNCLQLNVIAVVSIGHIDTNLVVLFGMQTLREGHCFSFHLSIWIEETYWLHTFVGRKNGWERTIGIVSKLFYGNTTGKATTTRQLTCMIEEVAMSLVISHTRVVCKRVCIAQRHNLASIFPWACWRCSCTIRDMFGHTTSSINQLVSTIALSQPRAFHIAIFVFLSSLTILRSAKAFFSHIGQDNIAFVRNHVFVQLEEIELWVTPAKPCLTIFIDKCTWIDMVPRTIFVQWLTDSIAERACRRIAHGNTNCHTTRNL